MLSVVTPPVVAALTLADLKARLRLDPAGTADDAALTAFRDAATAALDGPDGWLGRALLPQELEWAGDGFPPGSEPLTLPCPPIVAIVSASFLAADGASAALAATLVGRDLVPAAGTCWPATRRAPGAVRIRYRAGTDAVPAPVVQAIVLGVAAMNAITRGEVLSAETVVGVYSRSWATGGDAAADRAARALLGPYRILDR